MQNYVGSVLELQLGANGQKTVRITCPEKMIPAPGQYLLAHAPGDTDASLTEVLFPIERNFTDFVAALSPSPSWQPGTTLHLRGPLGKGFHLPGNIRNLALASLSDNPSRLLPLLSLSDNPALFTSSPSPLFSLSLPSFLEISPLSDLPDALQWADFLAFDIPIGRLPDLRKLLGLREARYLACPAQGLVLTPMPCGGIADCGVCAIGQWQRYQLVCKDGPVFDIKDIIPDR